MQFMPIEGFSPESKEKCNFATDEKKNHSDVTKTGSLRIINERRLQSRYTTMPTELLLRTFINLRPRLRAIADRLLQSQEEADDALQDAFCRLWDKYGKRNEDIESEGVAVITVRNMCLDRLRKSASHPTSSLDENENMDLADEDDNDSREETLDAVNRLISSLLPDRSRQILLMRDRDGMEFAEIAERFGLSEMNVRIIVSRARKAVRQAYLKQSEIQLP